LPLLALCSPMYTSSWSKLAWPTSARTPFSKKTLLRFVYQEGGEATYRHVWSLEAISASSPTG
jgi:hypothetical protein